MLKFTIATTERGYELRVFRNARSVLVGRYKTYAAVVRAIYRRAK